MLCSELPSSAVVELLACLLLPVAPVDSRGEAVGATESGSEAASDLRSLEAVAEEETAAAAAG